MASTSINYVGNGTETQYLINFEYLVKGFVQVYVDDVLKVYEDDYVFDDDQLIRFLVAPEDGAEILIQRDTSTSPITTFINPSILTAKDLNTASLQPLHKLEEIDQATLPWDGDTLSLGGGTIDMEGGTIINLGDPTDPKDAVTKEYVDAADAEINENLAILNTTVENNYTTLNNRIDGIEVAGVTISAEAGNAVTIKPDGLYVADLSQDITDIKADDVAQWEQIRTNTADIATNAENIKTNAENIRANSAAIVAVGNRVTTLEEAQAGGGFNTMEVIETSGTYTTPVSGWYKITVIGGGGGGGGGVWQGSYSVGGGGGASGSCRAFYKEIDAQSTLDIIIGAGGAGGSPTASGLSGGDTTVTLGTETITASGGGAGEGGNYKPGLGGAIVVDDGFGGQGASGGSGNWMSITVTGGGNGGNGGHNGTAYGSGGGGGGGGSQDITVVGPGGMGGTGNGENGGSGVVSSGGSGGAGGAGAVILEYYNEDSTTGGSSGGDTGGSSSVVISPQANNALVELIDGLFVDDLSSDVDSNTTGVSTNATSITALLQRVATLEDTVGDGATVTISAESGNAIITKTDGIFVADLSDELNTISTNVTTIEERTTVLENAGTGVSISAESGNAITTKTDGLYVADLSSDITAIKEDDTAQWDKINDSITKITSNTTNITAITERVITLESSSSGGGSAYFDEIIHEESGTFTAEVTGTYMVTVCGGGGGGGAGSPYQGSAYGSSPGGGGGGAGECEVVTVDMTAGEEYTVVIGAAGIGGIGNTSGNAVTAATDGGATSFTSTTTTIEVEGGMAGVYGSNSKPGVGGRGASGGILGYRVNTGGNGGNGANGGFNKYGAGGGGGHGGGQTTALSDNGYAGYGGWGAGDAYQSQTAGYGGDGGAGSQGVVRLVWSRKS